MATKLDALDSLSPLGSDNSFLSNKRYCFSELPNLRVDLLGRRITLMTAKAIMDGIHKSCLEEKKITIASYNVHSFNLSMQLPWFYEFQQGADITRCDGVGILKALRWMGMDVPLQYRVSGTAFVPQLLEYGNQHGFSFFFLGSKTQYLEEAMRRVKKKYPKLKIAGHDGYFDKQDPQQNQTIVDQINQFKPNILLVGMGVPTQEQWIQKHSSELEVNVIMPCGAVIDRLAGVVTNCPAWLSNLGLEWLHRLILEPRRLGGRYLIGNTAFLLHLALAKSLGLLTLRVSKM
ncbi:MAG: WecB/TagA/CpsF family glycosyltransferase [Xenococcaceae cyanobacterium MO_188.B29]|nr:WecB/TagA/CpsF family glycosyltransferase [Xenococcaceae cyanobacterium MO_188.B29]